MKWTEKGICFEGSVEEFLTIHPEMSELSGGTNCPPVETEDSVPQKGLKRNTPPRPHIVVSLDDGGCRHFKSAASAFRWYSSSFPDRKFGSYTPFKDTLKNGNTIKVADATIKTM